jgi:branched-subunit amino acid aminotransferase/4-amino-4-deoxychorismate lyase
MPAPQAYLNGHFIPAAEALLPVSDGGFVQGTTVAEQLRTFGGQIFRLEEHVERLFHSLAVVEIDPGLTPADFITFAQHLIAKNYPLLTAGDDLGLAMFVTPGSYSAMVEGDSSPTVCLHTFPLRFGQWAARFQQGESLATTEVRQVPTECWPPELKCRSRMHYYLADRQARRTFPGSRALMLDQQGFVVEATTANIILYRATEGLLLPPSEKILPGISQAVLLEIASELGIASQHRDLVPADVATADEVFLTSTSPCMIPVVRLNGQSIASGHPGPAYAKFMAAWSQRVGIDIIAQAQRFAHR